MSAENPRTNMRNPPNPWSLKWKKRDLNWRVDKIIDDFITWNVAMWIFISVDLLSEILHDRYKEDVTLIDCVSVNSESNIIEKRLQLMLKSIFKIMYHKWLLLILCHLCFNRIFIDLPALKKLKSYPRQFKSLIKKGEY